MRYNCSETDYSFCEDSPLSRTPPSTRMRVSLSDPFSPHYFFRSATPARRLGRVTARITPENDRPGMTIKNAGETKQSRQRKQSLSETNGNVRSTPIKSRQQVKREKVVQMFNVEFIISRSERRVRTLKNVKTREFFLKDKLRLKLS